MNFRSGSERTRPPGTSGSGASGAPLGVGVGTARQVPPQPALRTETRERGGGSQLSPRASRGRTCARSPARPGVGCGSSAGGEGAPWDGEAAWTRPGPAGEAGGRPRSATAAGGGPGTHRRGETLHGGRGLRLRCGGGSAAIAARQVGARPSLPAPPGPPPAPLHGRGARAGTARKGRAPRGPNGARGSLTASPGAVGLHVPPRAAEAAASSPPLPRSPAPATATAARAQAGAGAGAAASAAATAPAAPAPAPAARARPRPRPCPCRARPRRRPSPRALSLVEE